MKNWSLDDVENGNEKVCEKNNSNDPYGLLLLFVDHTQRCSSTQRLCESLSIFSISDSLYNALPCTM